MSQGKLIPCLWFDDQAEAAARFYTETFPDGRIRVVSHYPEGGENPGGKEPGSVLTVEFEIAGQPFSALNGGPVFKPNPSISFFVRVTDAAEAERLYGLLVEGGSTLMPLDRYPWSEQYAWVEDRFGISWQLMTTSLAPGEEMIVPCLMFAGVQQGRAEEAMEFYAGVFPRGKVQLVERYRGEDGPEGLMYGGFFLDGQEMAAMDSGVEQEIPFSEGISLQVMCEDQAEVDHYWATLSDGGETSVCGWLKDRFGVSWQVVPEMIDEWFSNPDKAARDRAFRAMLDMTKLDIALLEAALHGE